MKKIPANWFCDYSRHYGVKPDETGAVDAAFVRKALRLKAGDSLLDAPCGAGRLSVPLAQAGIYVTGVDLTRSYLRRARARFGRNGLRGKFVHLDLRAIDFQGEFDAVLNWGGSFGFFSEAENLDVVRRYAVSLRPGGRLLIDQPGREYLLRHFRRRGRYGDAEYRVRWNRRQQRFETHFRNVKSGESWAMTIRSYTPAQFGRLFRQAGLEVEAFYSDLSGRRYTRGARRLYVLGRRR
jgi:SAM-dependent methyltransferase